MKALRLRCRGMTNSFRQPDFHTFHRTLPLPPKTTLAGLIGAALGIAPDVVNDDWLTKGRFQVSITGKSQGLMKDLWQYRKYTAKHIKEYESGKADFPWFTAVMVREMLYENCFNIYYTCAEETDLQLLHDAFSDPKWALSLGREDELIKITSLETIDLHRQNGPVSFNHTVLPFDIYSAGFNLAGNDFNMFNNDLLSLAPSVVRLPTGFTYKDEVRQAASFQDYTFVGNLAVKGKSENCFTDPEADPISGNEVNLIFD